MVLFERWGRKALPGRDWKRFQSLRAADRHAISGMVMACPEPQRKQRLLEEIGKRLDPPAVPSSPVVPQKLRTEAPRPVTPPPPSAPPPRKRKLPTNFLPGPPPLPRDPPRCAATGCDWGVDHRPRAMADVVGNPKAKRALKEWMEQRRQLVKYINQNRSVRGQKYRAALKGNRTGDPVFDKGRIPAVALLHGPPGVGKTTLASLFMREHGLRCHEVNASDVNTGDRLYRVLQETAYAPRTGLILDEFDGVFDTQEMATTASQAASNDTKPSTAEPVNPNTPMTRGDAVRLPTQRKSVLFGLPKRSGRAATGSTRATASSESGFAGDHGMGRFMDSLKAVTAFHGPVVLIANALTARHIKELRTGGHCLDVRMYPIDARDMLVVLNAALAKHGHRLPEGVKKRLVADAAGDVRHMLHAAQFEAGSRSASMAGCVAAVTSGSDAQSDQTFADAASLLSGGAALQGSTLYSDHRLTVALAFHNYLPACVTAAKHPAKAAAGPQLRQSLTKAALAAREADALDRLARRVDDLCVADMAGSGALGNYRTHNRIALDVLEQGFRADPVRNARNVYKSQLAPGDYNVTWPPSALLKYRPPVEASRWLSFPTTLPRDPWEERAWVTCIGEPGKLHSEAQCLHEACTKRLSLQVK